MRFLQIKSTYSDLEINKYIILLLSIVHFVFIFIVFLIMTILYKNIAEIHFLPSLSWHQIFTSPSRNAYMILIGSCLSYNILVLMIHHKWGRNLWHITGAKDYILLSIILLILYNSFLLIFIYISTVFKIEIISINAIETDLLNNIALTWVCLFYNLCTFISFGIYYCFFIPAEFKQISIIQK